MYKMCGNCNFNNRGTIKSMGKMKREGKSFPKLAKYSVMKYSQL